MKLYEVTKGYTGDGSVRAYCVAESEQQAFRLATKKFYNAGGFNTGKNIHPDSYYKNLSVKLICNDVSNGFCSEVTD